MTNYFRVEPTHQIDEHDRARMRAGDVIVLAYLDENTTYGEIIALGAIRQVREDGLTISWRAVNITLFPSPWGIPKWRTMPVFKFPTDRAKHYRLAEHYIDAFGAVA